MGTLRGARAVPTEVKSREVHKVGRQIFPGSSPWTPRTEFDSSLSSQPSHFARASGCLEGDKPLPQEFFLKVNLILRAGFCAGFPKQLNT